jgi:hypothetical protein
MQYFIKFQANKLDHDRIAPTAKINKILIDFK